MREAAFKICEIVAENAEINGFPARAFDDRGDRKIVAADDLGRSRRRAGSHKFVARWR